MDVDFSSIPRRISVYVQMPAILSLTTRTTRRVSHVRNELCLFERSVWTYGTDQHSPPTTGVKTVGGCVGTYVRTSSVPNVSPIKQHATDAHYVHGVRTNIQRSH